MRAKPIVASATTDGGVSLESAAFASDQEQHYRHIERKLTKLLKKVEIGDVDAKLLIDALNN